MSHPGQRAAGGCFQPALIPPCGLKMMLSSGACDLVDAQISAAGWQSESMLVGNPRKLVSDLSQSRCWCRDTLHHTQAWHGVFPAAWHRLESIALSRKLQSVLCCLRGLKSTVKFQYSYKNPVFYFSTGSLFRRRQCNLVIDSWSLVGASVLGYRGHRSRGASRNTLPASATRSSWAPEAEGGSCLPSV